MCTALMAQRLTDLGKLLVTLLKHRLPQKLLLLLAYVGL